jgi:hypothetical protein
MEFKIKPLVKGTLSFAVPPLRTTHHGATFGTGSSAFCYSVFLRHFSYISQFTNGKVPRVVAEFGPGSSIGMGLAALIAGAELYYGLDIEDHTDSARNLLIFDDLVDLFRRRTPVPSHGLHETTFPPPLKWEFPERLEKSLDSLLDRERIGSLRDDLSRRSGKFIQIAVPWTAADIVPAHSIDWLFSHSVMEHVDDFEGAYQCFARWLKSRSMMTLNIDYRSHEMTRHWNGHWALSDLTWTLMRGRRPYLLNRVTHSGHINLIKYHKFSIEKELHHLPEGGLPKDKLAAAPRHITGADSVIGMAFVVCQSN